MSDEAEPGERAEAYYQALRGLRRFLTGREDGPEDDLH